MVHATAIEIHDIHERREGHDTHEGQDGQGDRRTGGAEGTVEIRQIIDRRRNQRDRIHKENINDI